MALGLIKITGDQANFIVHLAESEALLNLLLYELIFMIGLR